MKIAAPIVSRDRAGGPAPTQPDQCRQPPPSPRGTAGIARQAGSRKWRAAKSTAGNFAPVPPSGQRRTRKHRIIVNAPPAGLGQERGLGAESSTWSSRISGSPIRRTASAHPVLPFIEKRAEAHERLEGRAAGNFEAAVDESLRSGPLWKR